MIIYFISLISLCFCVITYLWEKHKRENKKAKIIDNGELWVDDITTHYRRRDGDYPTGGEDRYYPDRDYFIPLKKKKEDFLPKKRMKVHKLDQGIRKQTLVGPGVYTTEVDHSIIVRRNRDE